MDARWKGGNAHRPLPIPLGVDAGKLHLAYSVRDSPTFRVDIVDQSSKLESILNNADDRIEVAASRAEAARAYFADNSAVIDSAFQALSAIATSDVAKKSTADILLVVNKVATALNCVKQIHPFLGVAVLAFEGIVALERKRRENDRRVQALILQNADMMAEFLQLRDLRDSTLFTDRGVAIPGRLQAVLDKIVAAVKDCGNAIDKFYNTKLVAKFFKAPQWESKFVALTSGFAQLKKDVRDALVIRTALRVEDVASGVSRIDLKLDNLFALLATRSSAEQALALEVQKRGGAEACLGNTAMLKELVDCAGDGPRRRGADSRVLDAAFLHDLHTPLETQLNENREVFEAMLSVQTAELKDAIQGSETRIIHAFQSGAAFRRVKDPHVRHVWKVMKWNLSTQTTYFIAAIHDYFLERFSHISSPNSPESSNIASARSTPFSATFSISTNADEEQEAPPAALPSERWCIDYLEVFYVPALKEAFDDDTNGLINVREVNAYSASRHRPEHWTILQRLAYSAAGWHLEQLRYRDMIQTVLNTVTQLSEQVLPANRGLVCEYLDSGTLIWVKKFMKGFTQSEEIGAVELEALVSEHIEHYQAQVKTKLEAVRYAIPQVDFAPLLFGKDRMEQYFLPVLYLLLLRHAQMMQLGTSVVLDRLELERNSVDNVIAFARQRMAHLAETFRQQGVDPHVRFKSFHKGLYDSAWNDAVDDAFKLWRAHENSAESMGIELESADATLLRFSPPRPVVMAYGNGWHDEIKAHESTAALGPLARFRTAAQSILCQIQQSRSWDHQAARSRNMRSYAAIGILAALDDMSWGEDEPSFLSPQEQRELQRLRIVLAPRDLAFCRARADLALRHSRVVHAQSSCAGCHRCPIVGLRYDCLDCEIHAYSFCEDCVSKPKPPYASTTHIIRHNMLVFRTEISRDAALRSVIRASQNLKYYLVQARAQRAGKPGTELAEHGHEAPLQCSECADPLHSSFYCCMTCPETQNPICVFCAACMKRGRFKQAGAHEQNGHLLALVRGGDAHPAPHETSPALHAHAPTVETLAESVDTLNARVVRLEAKMDTLIDVVRSLTAGLQVVISP